MAMDRQEYPAMLASLQPNQATEVLNDRVRQVGRLNTDIADWLAERRRIEEQYSSGLRKLSKRPAVGDPNELGVFSTPFSALVNALDTLAECHEQLAQKIESDVERPLRDFQTKNREMQAMSTIQGNLTAMAKEIENAQKKSDKLQDKGTKASTGKAANVSRDLDNAQSQWDSQAPYVFETLQAVDETRLNHLRDVLTQFQTHEVDLVERNRVAVEQCLNVLLQVETADEIKTFAIRTTSARDRLAPSRSRQQGIASSPSTPNFSSPADDRASQRSDSVSDLPTPRPEKARGLKRLGTVLARRRESKIPIGADRISESPERRSPERKSRLQSSSTFSSLSSRLGRSNHSSAPLEPPHEDARERPRSPLRAMSSLSEAPTSPAVPTSVSRELPATNGTAAEIPGGSHQADLTGLTLDEPLQPSTPAADPTKSRETPLDNEGFSTRPPALDPISQAQQDAAGESSTPQFNVNIRDQPANQDAGDADVLTSMANTLKMSAPPPASSRRAGTLRGRRDVRASVYDPAPQTIPGPVSEEGPVLEQTREVRSETPVATQTAAPVYQPPPIQAPQPVSPPVAPAVTRDPFSQASTFSPFQSAPGLPASPLSAAIRPGSALGEDTQSIRSGRSLTSVGSQTHKHPDLTAAGLNASVIETVSAWFEDGAVSRSAIIGEVALVHNAMGPTGSNSEAIRLDSFASLEKVAPNPAFLTPIDGRQGEYTLNTSQIPRAQIGFKYQVQTPSHNLGAHAPILLQPAWRIEATQTSAILTYGLNPSFDLRGQTSISLSNVTLVLYLDNTGGRAASCQSKPVGTFNKDRNCIYWSLGDVTLSQSSGQQKLLARFVTEGEAKKGRAEARWEINGPTSAGSALAVSVKSNEDDPFSDEDVNDKSGGWRNVQGSRKVLAGTYQGV